MTGSFFETAGPAVRLELVSARGSTPREVGTVMYVSADRTEGTIGGGRLEFIAIEAAREMLSTGAGESQLEIPLGPEIGQCCGGYVVISLLRLDAGMLAREAVRRDEARRDRPAIYIFGAGHVGRALAAATSLLPVPTVLVDEREEQLALCHAPVEQRLTPLPEAEVRRAPPGSAFVVLTHDHALDFIVVAEALMRGDAAYVGMIGSKTKRASFERWCEKSSAPVGDTAPLVCPIGSGGSGDKRPEVIAAFVAAEVIARLTEARAAGDAATQQELGGGGLHG
ncbi:xanthine dehydrogenase accessory protein XdhC [Nisaea sp.]|uniref:xanthine dehydrogenase accessory protein XdhC n=1 Tax=Nisaea sp. TaxID=2024842 RepID=UPI003B517C90